MRRQLVYELFLKFLESPAASRQETPKLYVTESFVQKVSHCFLYLFSFPHPFLKFTTGCIFLPVHIWQCYTQCRAICLQQKDLS